MGGLPLRGTGYPRRCGKRNGGLAPARHRLSLPLWGLKGGLPSLLPAAPAFSLLSFPHPPYPPSQREGGDFLLSYARGFAPCIPAIEPEAALTEPAEQVPKGG